MKNLFSLFITFLLIANLQAQNVGIGTMLPDSSAMLELKSANRGFLLPRLDDTSLVNRPVEGLFIYNKNTKTPFFHNGVKWQGLSTNLLTSDFGDSVTYTITGIGTATELPATTMSQSVTSPSGQGANISFGKKSDVNTVPIHKAIFTNTKIATVEFKFYQAGASTPTVSVKITNVLLIANAFRFGNAQNGGLSDENYSCTYDVYGFKDWVHSQSFGYNLLTHILTTY